MVITLIINKNPYLITLNSHNQSPKPKHYPLK